MNTQAFKKIILEAPTYRKRGQIHGELLRGLIIEHQARWEEDVIRSTGLRPDAYLDGLLNETNFMPAIERWTPFLMEEVRGMAEGANIDFRYMFARQLSDEEPWYRAEKKLPQTIGRGCSSIGRDASDDHVTMIGQNMDTPAWYDGHQFLFHHKGPDLAAEVLNFSLAGKLNLCGMNSHGLAVCCNSLTKLDYSRNGLPEDFVVRGFLAQHNLEEGLAFMHDIEHASGQNYIVAGKGSRATNLEVSAKSIAEYQVWPGADRVYHTNHTFRNTDNSIQKAQVAAGQIIPGSVSTKPRYQELAARFSDKATPVTIEHMKAAFSSHNGPICRHPDDGSSTVVTLGCIIMELGEKPLMHLAPGTPCTTPFKTYQFEGDC